MKTWAERLGHSSEDRLVVIHADDVGLCEASVAAYRRIASTGAVSAASAMVPCPWFPAVARWCTENPTLADMGVHLVLNSEWDDYRWGPISGRGVPSLRDELGYFLKLPEATHRRADRDEVYRELRAQIAVAVSAGIDVTHIDSHIFAVKHPLLVDVYVRLSREHRVPSLILRKPDPEIEHMGLDPGEIDRYYRQVSDAEAEGLVVFDSLVCLPLKAELDRRLDAARRGLDALPPGLSVLVMHPAADTPELRAIASDWKARVADHALLTTDEWPRALESSGVTVIGMRAIRDALRQAE